MTQRDANKEGSSHPQQRVHNASATTTAKTHKHTSPANADTTQNHMCLRDDIWYTQQTHKHTQTPAQQVP